MKKGFVQTENFRLLKEAEKIVARRGAREASLVLAMERAAALSPGWHEVWNTAREGLT